MAEITFPCGCKFPRKPNLPPDEMLICPIHKEPRTG